MREPPGPAGQDRAPHPIEMDVAEPAGRSPGTSSSNTRVEAAFCAPENRVFVLIAAILASALGFMDGSVIALALPAIRADLGASLAQAQWINNGYLLPLGALILLGGALGDRFGLARVFSLGIGIFVAASMACAAAPGPEVLIAARVVQGLGAALMIPGSLALIARSYPEGERGRAIGLWASAAALTTALGPIVGGVVLSLGEPSIWRWIFAINLPLGGLALWFILRAVQGDRGRPGEPLDVIGALTITAGLGLIALGLTAEGEAGPRPALAWTGLLFVAVFLWWEGRTRHPMLPLSLFKNAGFAAANAATALIYGAFTAVVFFLPMTLVAGWEISEILAAAAFAPLSVFIPLLSPFAGGWADRFGPGRVIAAGGAILGLGLTALGLGIPLENFWLALMPATSLLGIGMAMLVAPLSTAVMSGVPGGLSGIASATNNAVSRVAGLIAIAAFGTILASRYSGAGGLASFGELSDSAGHGAAMNAAFQALALTAAAFAALGAIIALSFIPKKPPNSDA